MYLSFRGKVYQQVHGTAMGSQLSVVVANLVRENIEQRRCQPPILLCVSGGCMLMTLVQYSLEILWTPFTAT